MSFPLHGLVLGGGRSCRMQRDKGQLAYHGMSQIAWTANVLREFCQEVRVSVRPGQEGPADVVAAPLYDRHGSVGPLDGILSALSENPEVAWLVVACDLPLLNATTLRALVGARRTDRPVTAFRSSGDGLPEPLCAIYEPQSRVILDGFLERKMHSPRRILMQFDLALLDLPDPCALDNVNTPEEYEAVRKTIGKGEIAGGGAMQIKVLYFAGLREDRGCESEVLQVERDATPEGVYRTLRDRHRFRLSPDALRVAVNEDFADWETRLNDGDELVFLPPMAGG